MTVPRPSPIVRFVHLAELIDELSRPAAYPYPAVAITVCQTHVSVVFLAGDFAYKIKKPVDFGFLDFTRLEDRHRICQDEVRLNRRLAPSVYFGVVPIVRKPGGLLVEADGEAVEWAVKMRRLDDQATLRSMVERGALDESRLEAVARRVASFHRTADRSAHIASFGAYEVVAGNARENFTQSAPEIGLTVSAAVFAELRDQSERTLADLRPLVENRAERGVPCDGHGDLRLEHIYLFPDAPPPDDLVIIDCLEYTERFRCADPVNDMAFTVMELLFAGRAEAARTLTEAYFRFSGDDEGRRVLPFYIAYRSIVRGKVRGFELRQPEIPAERRAHSLARAKAHFLLALGALATSPRRPALVLVGGLPGTGKSTLAHSLAVKSGFEVIHSDAVRKELAGIAASENAASAWQSGIYSSEWTRRTYEECLRRAGELLFEGKRVAVDASFASEEWRSQFLEMARRLAIPAVLFVCEAPDEIVRPRLAQRRGDISDADEEVYRQARAAWTPSERPTLEKLVIVDTVDAAGALGAALAALRARDLA